MMVLQHSSIDHRFCLPCDAKEGRKEEMKEGKKKVNKQKEMGKVKQNRKEKDHVSEKVPHITILIFKYIITD